MCLLCNNNVPIAGRLEIWNISVKTAYIDGRSNCRCAANETTENMYRQRQQQLNMCRQRESIKKLILFCRSFARFEKLAENAIMWRRMISKRHERYDKPKSAHSNTCAHLDHVLNFKMKISSYKLGGDLCAEISDRLTKSSHESSQCLAIAMCRIAYESYLVELTDQLFRDLWRDAQFYSPFVEL